MKCDNLNQLTTFGFKMTDIPGEKNQKFEREKQILPYRCVSLEIVVANEMSSKQFKNVNICC